MSNFSSNIFPSKPVLEKTGADDVIYSTDVMSSAKPDNIFWNRIEETLFRWLI
jgi:hypothetical protein